MLALDTAVRDGNSKFHIEAAYVYTAVRESAAAHQGKQSDPWQRNVLMLPPR